MTFKSPLTAFWLLVALASFAAAADDDEAFLDPPRYYNYEQLTTLLRRLEQQHPRMAKLSSIGRSARQRELWVLQVSADVRQERPLLTPMVKYVANMHGDETVGRQLTIYLAQHLLAQYGRDERVTSLLNRTDIHLMPSMNPDGYENSQEGSCESKERYVGRQNENNVDLNRDFPDQFEPARVGTILSGRQPETVATMTWIISRPFVLSGNLHGGAVVASYPFDDSASKRTCCRASLSPDDAVFRHLARTYARPHPLMASGDACAHDKFVDGITNGAFWYEVRGGMQDFNYVHSNCFEVTFELSCCKFPPAGALPREWRMNKESLLAFVEAAHAGAKGTVTNAAGEPVLDADVVVDGVAHNVTTSNRGEYWRLLLPGAYRMWAAAYGYAASEPVDVVVVAGRPTLQHFVLERPQAAGEGAQAFQVVASSTRLPAADEDFRHHGYEAMRAYLDEYARSYPSIARLRSIGRSVQGRDLWVFVVGRTPDRHVAGTPDVKYVANMHGNEVVGRELLLLLVRHLCENYMEDERVTRLLNTTRVHLLPSMNPDGYAAAHEGDVDSAVGRRNAHDVDLNRNFPDQYGANGLDAVREPETRAVMDWILGETFVLSANLHNGALVANYPFDGNASETGQPNPSPDDETFRHLAHVYAQAHRTMHLGQPCDLYPDERFPEGITNGAKWYAVTGGMQDWNYLAAGCMEVTLELGCVKYPPASALRQYWLDNREALLAYLEQAHLGIAGFVFTHIGHPLAHAAITVEGISSSVRTAPTGDFFRLIVPGAYNVTASALGYEPATIAVVVPAGSGRATVNFTLMKDDPVHWASAYDFGLTENVYAPRYHANSDLYAILASVAQRYPATARLQGGTPLHSLMVSQDAGGSVEGKLHVAVMGNLFATQPIGRELVPRLARHLLQGHHVGDPNIVAMLAAAVFHFVPVIDVHFEQIWGAYAKAGTGTEPPTFACNPIAADFTQVGAQLVMEGQRVNGNRQAGIVSALKHLLVDTRFDLLLNFEGGRAGIVHPDPPPFPAYADAWRDNARASPTCGPVSSGTDRNLTELILAEFGAPLFTAKVTCCDYPPVANIPYIWRDALAPSMAFLRQVRTGVYGHVVDRQGAPMRNATLRIPAMRVAHDVSHVTATFRLMLPPGSYDLEVECHAHQPIRAALRIVKDTMTRMDFTMDARMPGFELKGPGIIGYVRDSRNHAIPEAAIDVQEGHQVRHAGADGNYSIGLKPGRATVVVGAAGYESMTKLVNVNQYEPTLVVFTLMRDTSVWGVPRNVFILLVVLLALALAGCGVGCCVCCCRDKVGYGRLPQDDRSYLAPIRDFQRPIPKAYFDEDDDEYAAADNASSDDDVTYLSVNKDRVLIRD